MVKVHITAVLHIRGLNKTVVNVVFVIISLGQLRSVLLLVISLSKNTFVTIVYLLASVGEWITYLWWPTLTITSEIGVNLKGAPSVSHSPCWTPPTCQPPQTVWSPQTSRLGPFSPTWASVLRWWARWCLGPRPSVPRADKEEISLYMLAELYLSSCLTAAPSYV